MVWLEYVRGADVPWRCGLLYDKNMTSNNERMPGKLSKRLRNKSGWRNYRFSRQKSLLTLNFSQGFLSQSGEQVLFFCKSSLKHSGVSGCFYPIKIQLEHSREF